MTSAGQRLHRLAMNRHGKNRDPRLNKGALAPATVPWFVAAAVCDGTHGSHLFGLGETYVVELMRPRTITSRIVHRSGVTFKVTGFNVQTWSLWTPSATQA